MPSFVRNHEPMNFNRMPLVSVIVPTHNRANLLSNLLDSLLEQTYPSDRFEVLVVHNRSDDGTDAVVESFTKRAPFPVRYFLKDYNGPMESRQFGAEHAEGDIIAFIDDDCVASPDWLLAGVRCFTDEIGLVQGRTKPNPDQSRYFLEKTVDVPGPTPYFETCNIFYRKDAFEEVGGFSEEFASQAVFYGEDTDLGWKVIESGCRADFCANALVHHEVFSVSLMDWLLEPRRMHVWPYLVKKHPDIRRHVYQRYFLDRRTASFNLLVLGVLLGLLWNSWALLLCIPYIAVRYTEPTRHRNPIIKSVRLVAAFPRACVFFAALLSGTIRFRSVLL